MPVLQKLQHWSDPTDACEFRTSFSKPVLKVQFTELCTYSPTSPDLEVSACWMPKQLKPEQQAMHLMTCLDSLHCYDTETEVMMERVVTGDVSYHYKPSRAGKNRFESIRSTESIRIDSVWRIEFVFFDSVQFDYTIHISDIIMFVNCHCSRANGPLWVSILDFSTWFGLYIFCLFICLWTDINPSLFLV